MTTIPPLPAALRGLRIPMMAAPMFIVSSPELVIAQCRAGIIGSFPALNARDADGRPTDLEAWIDRIEAGLAGQEAAPFAVNLVLRNNPHLEQQVEILARRGVKIWITSLGAQEWVNEAAHAAGAIVLHDVVNNTFARKAIAKGADGLIAVAAGAGGHAGAQSPIALVAEIRSWFDGPLALGGAIGTGMGLLAAQAMGADMGYVGTAFIATEEAAASDAYKAMIVQSGAEDIVYTPYFTGIPANYLKPSIAAEGMDPAALPSDPASISAFQSSPDRKLVWKSIWGSGQGIAPIDAVLPVAAFVDRMEREYLAARAALQARQGAR